MVEFSGSISEQNQIDRQKKIDKKVTRIILLVILIMPIIAILSFIFLHVFDKLWLDALICEIVAVFVLIGIKYMPQKVVLRFRLAPHIIINENELMLECYKGGKRVYRKKKMSKVKKILDCGEVYYIIFKFGDITNSWICQKSNIINGTIEEFEEIFKSKIKRETKE